MSVWYSEIRLAEALGVTRDLLSNFRNSDLKKKDWKKDGREIFLSQTGLAKVCEKLGLDEGNDFSDCLQKNGDAPTPPEEVALELIVSRIFPNPHLLECVKPATGDEPARRITVRVASNLNFRPRMILRAAPDPLHPNLYRLEGRCPRFPGRW